MPQLTDYSVIQPLSLSVRYKKESKHLISTNAHVFKPTGVKIGLGIYYYSNIVPAHPLMPQCAVQTNGNWHLLAPDSPLKQRVDMHLLKGDA